MPQPTDDRPLSHPGDLDNGDAAKHADPVEAHPDHPSGFPFDTQESGATSPTPTPTAGPDFPPPGGKPFDPPEPGATSPPPSGGADGNFPPPEDS